MPKFAANLSMLFTEHAFLDRFAAAADAGFAAVECQFPYEVPAEAIATKLARHRLEMVLHNLPRGEGFGCAALPGRQAEFREGLALGLAYARALGCRQVNCLAGIAPAGADPAVLRATLIANLRLAAEAAAAAGIRLLVEPLNPFDFPGFCLARTDLAAEVIGEARAENLFLQYDLYHQQRTAGELIETFRRLQPVISHIQIADVPGRHEPGTGEINFARVLAAIEAAGYAGWIGCEYKPSAGTSASLAWLARLGN
jgi:hydroxypyruvate isomerase